MYCGELVFMMFSVTLEQIQEADDCKLLGVLESFWLVYTP